MDTPVINSLRPSDAYMHRKIISIGSDNRLSLGQCQVIIWIIAEILLIGPLGTNFNEISIEIQTFSLNKICLKMTFAQYGLFCLGLNVLTLPIQLWSRVSYLWRRLALEGLSLMAAVGSLLVKANAWQDYHGQPPTLGDWRDTSARKCLGFIMDL